MASEVARGRNEAEDALGVIRSAPPELDVGIECSRIGSPYEWNAAFGKERIVAQSRLLKVSCCRYVGDANCFSALDEGLLGAF